ncbi:MAG: hypothetical protein LBO04_05990 [Spirochaetaceae bacterium]|jgi:hypothetical protein|nr:hypothetical protein [Spirochaetaceae bacterium]
MDSTGKLMAIAEKKIGILPAKRLFCVLLVLFEIYKKTIAEKLNVSRLTVKKYRELADAGNIEGIFSDTVYRRRSGTEDYRDGIMAEPDKKPEQTPGEAAAVIVRSVRTEAESAAGDEGLKKNGFRPLRAGFCRRRRTG